MRTKVRRLTLKSVFTGLTRELQLLAPLYERIRPESLSAHPTLRGLVVEVDAGTDPATNTVNTAWNQLTGTLSAPRGNITLVGLAVNQDGRVSATTSVSANGSIRLEAAAGANAGFGTSSTGAVNPIWP